MKTSLFETDAQPPDDSAVYVHVAVERGLELGTAEATLTYRADAADDHAGGIGVGHLVEVPLGRGNTATRGIVVAVGGAELLGRVPPSKVKPITRFLARPLTPELVDLGRWISRYYICPLGMTLGSMLPAAVKQEVGRRTAVLLRPTREAGTDTEDVKLSPTAARAWAAIGGLPADTWPASARDVADLIGEKTVGPINRLVRAGLLAEGTASFVRARDDDRDGIFDSSADDAPAPSASQRAAIEGVAGSLGSFSRHLLFGVTGSGKTEVYLRLLEAVLERGETAVMLVPEIALTPQTAGRVQSRLGTDRVAVLHSGLTAAQRNRAWSRLAEGSCRVVVGARSAVFAPVGDLGLIIVDEEHDGSYKQDQLPRYHARDVAIARAHRAGCPVLLGSATPSLESWHAAVAGRSAVHRLPERVGAATMPAVRIVDMAEQREQLAERGERVPAELVVGPTLAEGVRHALAEGHQILFLLNRRGFSGLIMCSDARCGFRQSCTHCDARLVLHRDAMMRAGGYTRCHHCRAEQRVLDRCPDCGSRLRWLGAGTQRAERVIEDLTADLPHNQRLVVGESLVRVDADTMRTARDYFQTLARFAKGEIRALLGTQMIAKGLDVAGVRLVGVLSADTALALPDFRASERTFQLVSQVAGRAGRGAAAGTVIVQTNEPDAPAIRLAAAHDYERFVETELRLRSAVSLPPVWRMARIVCRDRDAESARLSAGAIAEAAAAPAERAGARVVGPMPCPIERIADHFRFAVELTAPDAGGVQSVLRGLRAAGVLKSDAKTAVDVDPVALL